MQFGFMPGKKTVDAIFIVRRMQEEYQNKDKKLYMRFVDLEKAFDRLPRKVMEWALRKKGLSEVIVRAVMSLCNGAKTRVRVGSAYSEEFKVKVGVHQGSVLSPLLFAIVVDVITENARRGVVNELLYADDLVIMSEDMEDLKERFWNWKDALESKGLKVNTRKTRVRRKTIQKQDRSMWSLWEESHGQFSVVHKMWKLGSWQMCKNKESYR